MTEIEQFIITVVEDQAPIKGIDLALAVVSNFHATDADEIHQAIDGLVARYEILEIEYVLPAMDYRTKSLYFPKKTRLKIVR